ncbi:MAG: SpoIID/LytB domain-containing protein [Candidatus Gracilibacteria bacterium]|jgi:peptidoglycan hydrolase-like amidase|nr:SpoIID/LytB domain-containing protein [Candidatus Gracilibacteria bacterium]
MPLRKIKNLVLFFCISLFSTHLACANNFWKEKVPTNEGAFFETEQHFNAFTVEFRKEFQDLDILYKTDRTSEFRRVDIDDDNVVHNVSGLYFADMTNKIMFRTQGANPPSHLVVHFYNTSQAENPVHLTGKIRKVGTLSVISREEWGADENFRYNGNASKDEDVSEKEAGSWTAKKRAKECGIVKNVHPEEFEIDYIKRTEGGKSLTWPYQYSKRIFKVVIHHTAENNVIAKHKDPKEVIRGIYYYHAKSKGWGDIGYHFIIDPYGNIYEGRAGGNYVIGGHAYCNNIGTIGVSLMGNFEEGEPTKAQIKSLGKLLPQLALIYELDLTIEEEFHGKKMSNLVGHRDLRATACPGKNMYKLLPKIRKALLKSEEIIKTKSFKYSSEATDKINIIQMKTADKHTMLYRFRNTGNIVWDKSTWLYAFVPKTGGVSVDPAISGRQYVAAKMQESRVPPGKIATFEVEIETKYRGGLFTLELTPVVNNKKISEGGIIQPIEVEQPKWGAKLKEVKFRPKKPYVNKRISSSIDLKNTGNTVWKKDYITLSIFSGRGRKRQEVSLSENVAPGKIGHFNFSLDPYDTAGNQNLYIRMLLEGKYMPAAPSFTYKFNVKEKDIKVDPQQKAKLFTYIESGKKAILSMEYKNIGEDLWNKEDVKLEVYATAFRKTLRFNQKDVDSGEIATFEVYYQPENEGDTRFIMMLKNGKKVLTEKTFWFVKALDKVPERFKRRNTVQVKIQDEKKEDEISKKEDIDKNIRIKLSFDKNSAKLTCAEGMDIYADGNKILTKDKGESIMLSKAGRRISIAGLYSAYSNVKAVAKNNGTISVENWNRTPSWDINGKYNDNVFKGALEARVYKGSFTLINDLDLEDYLLGMAEVSSSTNYEKMKAMAILIRTYAMFYMEDENRKFPGAPFDGSDSPDEFQRYLGHGFDSRSGKWKDAINETKGMVVTYAGELVKTPYFNQSDGKTRSAKKVWGWTHTPYLKSVEDPYCYGMTRKGHGVGLSGHGAEKMAQAGKSFKEIIYYYYTGVKIKKI